MTADPRPPILSVNVDRDKKNRFAILARRHDKTMAGLVNDLIDRMLAADTIDIYADPSKAIDEIEARLKPLREQIESLNIEISILKRSIAKEGK